MEDKYSEKELLNQLKNKDKIAQEEFVKKYYNNMFSIAFPIISLLRFF